MNTTTTKKSIESLIPCKLYFRLLFIFYFSLLPTLYAQPESLTISPSSLDFGEIRLGDSATAVIQVQNSGNGILTVSDIVPSTSEIGVDYTEFSLAPQVGIWPVTVTFSPDPDNGIGSFNGTLTFYSDDPSAPQFAYSVISTIIAEPDIQISPASLHGELYPSESVLDTHWVTISNTGYGSASVYFSIFPPAPVLIAPFNADSLSDLPMLQWSESPSSILYNLQIAADPDFINLLLNDTLPYLSYLVTELMDGTYYWRVKAQNNAGWGEYSEVWSFTYINPWQCGDVFTDIYDNSYQTIEIGEQCWMAENLRTTHYRNGDEIPTGLNDSQWTSTTAGAYAVYDNNENYADTYGYLYNWYAVDDARNIAPEGWHVPSDAEFIELEIYLGMSESEANSTGWRGTDEGGKLKEAGTSHWNSPNTGATNSSGFTARPGGYRYDYNGNYYDMGNYGYFWSATAGSSDSAWERVLSYNTSGVNRGSNDGRGGFSVRLLRD